MEVIICSTAADAGRVAAGKVAQVAKARGPEVVIGFSTGSSPLATYADLTRRIDSGELDLSQAWGFALDEYVGLEPGHPESYAEVIRTTVTEPLRMNPERVFTPNGFAENLQTAGPEYEEQIRAAGGIDVQILGVGANGHIGFNEPGSSLASRTRIKTLTTQTRQDNSRFFASIDDVPRHCLTQGLTLCWSLKAKAKPMPSQAWWRGLSAPDARDQCCSSTPPSPSFSMRPPQHASNAPTTTAKLLSTNHSGNGLNNSR